MSEEVLTNEKTDTLKVLELMEAITVVYASGRLDILEGTLPLKVHNLPIKDFEFLEDKLRLQSANVEVDIVGDNEIKFKIMRVMFCEGKAEMRIFSDIYQKKEAQ